MGCDGPDARLIYHISDWFDNEDKHPIHFHEYDSFGYWAGGMYSAVGGPLSASSAVTVSYRAMTGEAAACTSIVPDVHVLHSDYTYSVESISPQIMWGLYWR